MSKDHLLQLFGMTLECLGFRRRTCHEQSQCKCYVKFACLKQKVIWVDPESLLIYLDWRNSGARLKRVLEMNNYLTSSIKFKTTRIVYCSLLSNSHGNYRPTQSVISSITRRTQHLESPNIEIVERIHTSNKKNTFRQLTFFIKKESQYFQSK